MVMQSVKVALTLAGVMLAITLIVAVPLLFLANINEVLICHNYEEMTGTETVFKVLDGCYVKQPDGTFFPLRRD